MGSEMCIRDSERAMEVASLAPNSEVTIYPWKDSQDHINEAVEHARRFLKSHAPE